MRIVYDISDMQEPQVCGGGHAYRNTRGFQGMDDMQVSLSIIIPEIGAKEGEPSDVVEFEGSAKKIVQMLRNALSAIEGSFEVCQKQSGPTRPTPCPDCDPLFDYPNATHTEECAFSKFWEGKRKQDQ
jgi:hypothetical protein